MAQLRVQFEAERAVLTDPEAAQATLEELTALKDRTDRLRGSLARWSQTLGDGIADLSADVDHDLRFRVRKVLEDADASVDGFDPADAWDDFESWLYGRMGGEIVANYALLRTRSNELAERVGELFEGEGGEISARLSVALPSSAMAAVGQARADISAMTTAKQGMTLLRGFYSSTLMLTMFTTLTSVTLGPFVYVIGLVMGRSGLREEKARQLALRRAQAKNAVRRYCDDVTFHVGKDSRDTLRRVQRQLRDHYSARAEELHRSTADSLKAAQQSVQQDNATREQRLRAVNAELTRLSALSDRVSTVAGSRQS